jgi:hypothetical protein
MMRSCLRSAIDLRDAGSELPSSSSSGLARHSVIDCGKALAGSSSGRTTVTQAHARSLMPATLTICDRSRLLEVATTVWADTQQKHRAE